MENLNKALINISNLSKTYITSNSSNIEALKKIDLHVTQGEILCIVGKSGCGKTTLLNIIAGVLQPTSGSVSVFNSSPLKMRSKISYMQQRPQLLPYRTVLQNAAIGVELRKNLTTESLSQITGLLDFLGLREFSSYYPKELSGGMQQRVALARTLAVDSPLILNDEPFISLDFETRLELEDLFWQTVKTDTKTSVFVTHDIESAVALGDRIMIMSPRPGTISKIIELEKDIATTRPLKCRQSPLFSTYFSEVWEALRKNDDTKN